MPERRPERRRRTGSFEVERTTGSHEVLDRLFVYGTPAQRADRALARREPDHALGQGHDRTVRSTRSRWGYPGLVEGDTGIVHGDVIWLSELAATFGLLDAFEGSDFARMVRKVTLETGQEIWAWIYVLADPGTVQLGTRIEDGDWVRYWTEQG